MPLAVRGRETFMREALVLARRPRVPPYPNPWVGCVIVRQGRTVGRGFHRGAGTDHAEIEALRQAGFRARGAALYVTLEPCCHFGRTPPCTDALLQAGIREVFYALRDPNPEVSGRSDRLLRAHGVQVHRGLCAREAAALNEVYLKFRATGLPFVSAKVAASLDGKIATRAGESKWITDAPARRAARLLRAQHQAVLVGINTILADDPHLGPRDAGAAEPWRIVLDSRLRIHPSAKVIRSGKCIIACTSSASSRKKAQLESYGAKVWTFSGKHRVPLMALARRLAAEEIISVLVEGGSEVLGSFFDQKLVDRVYWFAAPVIIGSAKSLAAIGGTGVASLGDAAQLRDFRLSRAGNSVLIRGKVSRWALA